MTERVHHHEHLIFSSGTQVVALREVIGQGGRILHPRGAVGVVVKSPSDLDHYVYRVLLTGIHLMHSGEVEASLVRLNEMAKLPYIPELIDRKTGGPEQGRLEAADLDFHRRDYERLRAELQQAFEQSRLPEVPSGAPALNDLLIRLRVKG